MTIPLMTLATIRIPFPFGPVDTDRVDLTEQLDLNFWTHELNCTAHQLCAALAAVGVKATAVRGYLRRLPAATLGSGRTAAVQLGRSIPGLNGRATPRLRRKG